MKGEVAIMGNWRRKLGRLIWFAVFVHALDFSGMSQISMDVHKTELLYVQNRPHCIVLNCAFSNKSNDTIFYYYFHSDSLKGDENCDVVLLGDQVLIQGIRKKDKFSFQIEHNFQNIFVGNGGADTSNLKVFSICPGDVIMMENKIFLGNISTATPISSIRGSVSFRLITQWNKGILESLKHANYNVLEHYPNQRVFKIALDLSPIRVESAGRLD